ncbi:MAG: phosphoglycolate phosphatase [Alphaproteobacteria bacterium]|nr:phosphoglycolate phosphatase [Alphaproteobacteria bacterium]MBU1513935.1 phosphoglycolate phosphatase [Alphaproteobacteria bacterium]MBU2092633.1 phosphoglycolate phosphatase [Alphaproteobacteria bacterium]MBU2154246.1 phosphoglycolate phosphatase [Alphaproteobacteria bacterium]MBU2309508.1 phosphoglycolate phosphatase [Alphaproteobacteria bacterium]
MAANALAGAVIAFDLDGTLVDTAPDLIGTLNVLLKEEGLPALPLDSARPFIGRGARWMIERGFEAAGEHLAAARLQVLFERFLVHYRAHIADESRPFPGCEAALDALKAQGAKLVVCTNKLTDLSVVLLEALNIADRFEAVIGADLAPAIKPDARHLQAAVDAVGGDIARTIMVGDAATDAGAARAAKAHLILVSFGYTEIPAADLNPDILIHSFDALPDACARLLGACEVEAGQL